MRNGDRQTLWECSLFRASTLPCILMSLLSLDQLAQHSPPLVPVLNLVALRHG